MTSPSLRRPTRSNSNPQVNVSLQDIKSLIDNAKLDILKKIDDKFEKVFGQLDSLNKRVQHVENNQDKLEERQTKLENDMRMIRSSTHDEEHTIKVVEEMRQISLRERNLSDESHKNVLAQLHDKENRFAALQSNFKSLNDTYMKEMNAIRSQYKAVNDQLISLDLRKRKESFIVRNCPETSIHSSNFNYTDKSGPTCQEIVASIANVIGIPDAANNIREAFRLGKPRLDGKPRLIMVKAPERTCRLFLSRARHLKQAPSPFSQVFLQEDLPPEASRRLAEMRKKAYEHRLENPSEEAYVKNKKLYINGSVVDEIVQNF